MTKQETPTKQEAGRLFTSLTDDDLDRDFVHTEWRSSHKEESPKQKGIMKYERRFYIKSATGKCFSVFEKQIEENLRQESDGLRGNESIDVLFTPKKSNKGKFYATNVTQA